jgi:glycine oxidase
MYSLGTTDVAVVGAGIIGCSVAYELSRRGVRVQVFDPRGIGSGATYASAGVLSPYIEGDQDRRLQALGVLSLSQYDAFVDRARGDAGATIRYSRTGSLEVVTDPEGVARLEATAARLPVSADARLLDAKEALEFEPELADGVHAALFVGAHGHVDVPALTRALAEAAVRHGAVFTQAAVKRIDAGESVSITLENAAASAGVVVLAAGSWSGDQTTFRLSPLPVRPVRGQLLHLGWPGKPMSRVIWGERCYLVPWDDGTLLVGATIEEVGFDERATTAGVRDLIEAAGDLVPLAWRSSFREARVGLRPAGPDDLPIIGRAPGTPSIVYATAHYRNGALLAPLTADIVAGLVIDNREDEVLQLVGPQRLALNPES